MAFPELGWTLTYFTFKFLKSGCLMEQLVSGVWGQQGLPMSAVQGKAGLGTLGHSQPLSQRQGSWGAVRQPQPWTCPWAQDEARQGCQPTCRSQEQALWRKPGSDTVPDRPGREFAGGLGLVMLTQELVTDTIDVSEQKLFCTPKNGFSECVQEISHRIWEIRSTHLPLGDQR